ncbi:TPA: DUF551 domain-containing protein [Escherichia coli]|uniref:DUF551 domain-containing protein n=2 Tax=Escherichia coli TaxID=562 RepID=UPI002022FD2A|nr:DUF551 domain-containing protein [Escherichia coli]
MSTIPKERLEQLASGNAWYCVQDDEAAELARIALASLEAEPVAYIFKHPAGKLFWALTDESNKEQADVIPVYAAAPASVVPDNASEPLAYAYKELTPEIMRNHLAVFERYGIAPNDISTTIQALRIALDGIERSDAMLHGAEPVSQTYKLPVNTPCQDAPAHIWLQTAGVWPEDGELSELTWCSHNQHHDDTLYVRADLVNGNYPVAPARLPGAFTIEDAKALHEDLVRSHISQALSGEKMKKNDRDADLRWIHGVIVQAAWFVKASLEQNALSGNSPVTPDGWISCSERMPAQDDWILIYSKHGEYMAGQVQGEYVELSDGTLSWLGNALYWMPLPEPTQEAK